MEGFTFDTGALIALERRSQRMTKVLRLAEEREISITLPTPVLAEWWREHGRKGERILAGMTIAPLTEHLAKLAGDALKAVPTATTIDAIVMASAAQRGDIVYTSDVDDLEALRAFFPSVRVLHV